MRENIKKMMNNLFLPFEKKLLDKFCYHFSVVYDRNQLSISDEEFPLLFDHHFLAFYSHVVVVLLQVLTVDAEDFEIFYDFLFHAFICVWNRSEFRESRRRLK